MELLKPTRRGFLGGLAAVALAPAIIRPGLLMRINPVLAIAPLGVYITAQMIATAMVQELYKCGSRRAIMLTPKQSCVTLEIPAQSRTLSMDHFIAQHVRPAAMKLAASCPKIGGPLEVPRGVHEAAVAVSGGFGVRYIQDYDIYNDRMLSRFDIIG